MDAVDAGLAARRNRSLRNRSNPRRRGGFSAALVVWTLALLGIGTIADGLISASAARVNGGTLCVLAVVLGKFFSDEFSFTVKGVVFITCGILFIATNLMTSRWVKRKAGAK